jgi:hypothetical protein
VGSGAVVVLLNPTTSMLDGWTLVAGPASNRLEPLGVDLVPIGVSLAMSGRVGDLLDGASEPEDDDGEDDVDRSPVERHLAIVDADRSSLVTDASSECLTSDSYGHVLEPEDDESAPIMLRFLGPVDVTGLAPGVRLRPIELELAIYIALHRNGQTADMIRTMLWPDGISDKTWHNVSSSLRRKLGVDPGGEPRLSHRGEFGRYALSDSVQTDWDHFLRHARATENAPSGEASEHYRRALELIDGPPFSDVEQGYSWAFSDGTVSEIDTMVAALGREARSLHAGRGFGEGLGRKWVTARTSKARG